MQHRRSWHVLVVDEDRALREPLASYLAAQGLDIAAVDSPAAAWQRLQRRRADLIVMDAGPGAGGSPDGPGGFGRTGGTGGMGGLSGLQACQRWRAEGDSVPVILLGSQAGEIDRIVGLELGADDYLGRPCAPRELLARIHAVLRRARPAADGPAGQAAPVPIGDWLFDVHGRSLVRGDERQNLGTVEFALLSELVSNPGTVVSRERLVAAAHGRQDRVLPRAVDAAVMRLRKRVEPTPARPRHLQTVRGRGYIFIASAGRRHEPGNRPEGPSAIHRRA